MVKKNNHISRDNKIPGSQNYHLKLYEEHTDYIISTLNTVFFFAMKAVMPLFTTHTLKLSLLHICIPLYLTLLPFGEMK